MVLGWLKRLRSPVQLRPSPILIPLPPPPANENWRTGSNPSRNNHILMIRKPHLAEWGRPIGGAGSGDPRTAGDPRTDGGGEETLLFARFFKVGKVLRRF